jgi:hypothetical protein
LSCNFYFCHQQIANHLQTWDAHQWKLGNKRFWVSEPLY